ncbi:hypothetical protein C0J52_12261, partial [Blattella germanica]
VGNIFIYSYSFNEKNILKDSTIILIINVGKCYKMIVNNYKCSNFLPFCSTHTRVLLLTLSQTPNSSAGSGCFPGII